MKGRYSGCRMTVYGHTLPGALCIARSAHLAGIKLTERAKEKVRVLDWHRKHGSGVSLTARHFGLTRLTVRRWLKRLRGGGPMALNDQSHRPKKLRKPTTPREVVIRVVSLRQKYPAWSKYKLRVLLRREGLRVSPSTIGRILNRKGLIDRRVSQKRRRSALRPKRRYPHGLRISAPGDMVQIDTKHVTLIGGKKIYQFTAIDVLTKQRVIRYHPSPSSRNGRLFLEECLRRFSFQIKIIQTDNGSEFLKEFDRCCHERNLLHYFIYPRQPKQNSFVEISHEADEKEFYRLGKIGTDIETMRQRLAQREVEWNTIRPHQALNQLTPEEYFQQLNQGRKLATKDTIILQT